MLMNMHHPPAESNFRDAHQNALKLMIVQAYNRHMVYVDEETVLSPAGLDGTKQLQNWLRIVTPRLSTLLG
jgi:hypothetical protein